MRLKETATSLGMEFKARRELHEDDSSAQMAVIDLDWASSDMTAAIPSALKGARVLGYYSHIDDKVGEAARSFGIDAYPRSRFWREAADLLAAPGPEG